MSSLTQVDRDIILKSIRDIPDFPKEGILFKDITTMLGDAKAFGVLIDHLVSRYSGYELNYIAGIDARGFIFGAVLANRLGVGFVPIRKKGKLPYTTLSQEYSLEYGVDEVEVHIDAFGDGGLSGGEPSRVLLVDDLIATGGTAKASYSLIERVGAKCVECCFVMELGSLHGRDKFDCEVYSVLEID